MVVSSSFAARSEDSSFTFAIANDGKLYKYDTTYSTFTHYFTPPILFPTDSHINYYQNRLIINSTSQISATVYAYDVSGTTP